ncbi:hypothetical protein FB45DRAFT_1029653 [Roridomyces roridus]|uniref:Uncharacterized protein n=1 Tax=Roridomyces roridus TaxID=1738132 RepID=A0AAD7BQ46_9AGAR|nr:hypothetical protein FB45DRAFT_1029653 [Roridomyces roridus]
MSPPHPLAVNLVLHFLPLHQLLRPRPPYGVAAHVNLHIAHAPARCTWPRPRYLMSHDRTDICTPAHSLVTPLPADVAAHPCSPAAESHSLRRRMLGWRLREAPTPCVIPFRKLTRPHARQRWPRLTTT